MALGHEFGTMATQPDLSVETPTSASRSGSEPARTTTEITNPGTTPADADRIEEMRRRHPEGWGVWKESQESGAACRGGAGLTTH